MEVDSLARCAPYSFRICFIVLAVVARKNRKQSSTKNKWDMEGAPPAMRHPWMRGPFSRVLITALRASAQIMNRYGDSGSPVEGELGPILSRCVG